MPFADLFQPDINFVSARNVYPTAPGGTASGAGAAMSGQTAVNVVDPATGSPAVTVAATGAGTGGSPRTLGYWFGLVVLLLIMVFVARKAGGEEDFRNVRPTLYNFLAITLTAIVGIVGLKAIFSKYKVPGLTDVILAA
jgi:hypothetical protein